MDDILAPVPIFLLTGFLGAGKTTFLNRALAEPGLAKTCVIVNEFGAVGLDHLLVEGSANATEGVLELANGCACCAVRGDFLDTLLDVVESDVRYDRIIVELSGLAEPGPILQAAMAHPVLQSKLSTGGVICLVDAMAGLDSLENHHEAEEQLRFADCVVITKLDLVENTTPLIERVLAIAPDMDVKDAMDIESISSLLDDMSNGGGLRSLSTGHHHHHHHDDGVASICLRHDKPLSEQQVDLFLSLLTSAHGDHLLRIKGLILLTDQPNMPLLVQGVGRHFHPPRRLESWPLPSQATLLVIITRGLDVGFVEALFRGFIGDTRSGEADAQALVSSPLTPPGFTQR